VHADAVWCSAKLASEGGIFALLSFSHQHTLDS